MARYYHRPRFNYHRYNETQRSEAKQGLGGVDDDVLQIFNGLDGLKRTILFRHYELVHGKSAATYARNKMGDWASGAVRASGKTLTRMLQLVPKILDQNQKYGLLKKLYDSHRGNHHESHSFTVVVGHTTDAHTQLTALTNRLCEKPVTHTLPAYVQEKISWVCDHDSKIARSIMAAIEKEHSHTISLFGRVEVQNLILRIQNLDVSAEGTHTIRLPFGTITVYVRKPNLFEKIRKFFS